MNDPSDCADYVWRGPRTPEGQRVTWRMPVEANLRWGAQRAGLLREAVSMITFPLFGLPADWPGTRFLGGIHRSWPDGMDRERDPGVVHSIALIHGSNVDGEGPQLVVESASREAEYGGGPLRVAAERVWAGRRSVEEGPDRHGDPWLRVARSATGILVGDEPVLLDVVSSVESGAWVGRAQLPKCRLTIESMGFLIDGLELVAVTDIRRYKSP